MRSLFVMLALVAMTLAQRQSVQRELSSDLQFSNYPDVVPKIVFDFLEEFNWGDYHQVFHMARKFYFLGEDNRGWLKQAGEKIPELQEGDPLNGIEFLAMHRSMIQQLKDLFGDEKVTNDPEGFKTMNQVLDGWTTDADVIKGLQKVGGDVTKFKAGLVNVNKFGQFKTEDEFGNFLQTTLRLTSLDPNDSSQRTYDYDRRAGAGVHNWLHGQFHTNSPITVGNPRSNLANIMFWRIHGWIEAKWIQFEKTRTRTAEEKTHYDRFMKMFDSRMDDMAQGMPGAIRAGDANAEREEEAAVRSQREAREVEERERKAKEEREREAREERERVQQSEAASAEARRLEETRREAERKRVEENSRQESERVRLEAESRRRETEDSEASERTRRLEESRRSEAERLLREREATASLNRQELARIERVQREAAAAAAARRASETQSSSTSTSSNTIEVCAKASSNVRTGTSLANGVVYLAAPGYRAVVDRSKSVGKWMYLTGSRGSGYALYSPRRWGLCASSGREPLSVKDEKSAKSQRAWRRLRRKLRRAFRKVKKVPKEVVKSCLPVMFVDRQPCWRYSSSMSTPECPKKQKK